MRPDHHKYTNKSRFRLKIFEYNNYRPKLYELIDNDFNELRNDVSNDMFLILRNS